MRLKREERIRPTCTNHLLNFQMSGIYFTGELFDSFTGVLISGRVHIVLDST